MVRRVRLTLLFVLGCLAACQCVTVPPRDYACEPGDAACLEGDAGAPPDSGVSDAGGGSPCDGGLCRFDDGGFCHDWACVHVAPDLELAMSQAVGVGEDVLLEAVAATKLPYSTFFYCTPTGEGRWAIEKGDSVSGLVDGGRRHGHHHVGAARGHGAARR